MNKIQSIFDHFKQKSLAIMQYSNTPSTDSRIVDSISSLEIADHVIFSTYFTTKKDPQRNTSVANDTFDYIKDFYHSVLESKYHAIIFHDSLSEEFIQKYQNKQVQFVRCQILQYSLNDERYYIYREFLLQKKPKKVLLCDVNDVTFNKEKNFFSFINDNAFYIGRDEMVPIEKNSWMKEKINILPESIQKKIPRSFLYMPVVNAGVIGGTYSTVFSFLDKIVFLFETIKNDNNNNMICTNIVFYDSYWRMYANTLDFKLISFRKTAYTRFLQNKTFQYKNQFYIGYPFTNTYKSFEKNSEAYIYHK